MYYVPKFDEQFNTLHEAQHFVGVKISVTNDKLGEIYSFLKEDKGDFYLSDENRKTLKNIISAYETANTVKGKYNALFPDVEKFLKEDEIGFYMIPAYEKRVELKELIYPFTNPHIRMAWDEDIDSIIIPQKVIVHLIDGGTIEKKVSGRIVSLELYESTAFTIAKELYSQKKGYSKITIGGWETQSCFFFKMERENVFPQKVNILNPFEDILKREFFGIQITEYQKMEIESYLYSRIKNKYQVLLDALKVLKDVL